MTRCICRPFLLHLFLCDTFEPKSTFATSVCVLLSTVHIHRVQVQVSSALRPQRDSRLQVDHQRVYREGRGEDSGQCEHISHFTPAHVTPHKHTSPHYTSTPSSTQQCQLPHTTALTVLPVMLHFFSSEPSAVWKMVGLTAEVNINTLSLVCTQTDLLDHIQLEIDIHAPGT